MANLIYMILNYGGYIFASKVYIYVWDYCDQVITSLTYLLTFNPYLQKLVTKSMETGEWS